MQVPGSSLDPQSVVEKHRYSKKMCFIIVINTIDLFIAEFINYLLLYANKKILQMLACCLYCACKMRTIKSKEN